MEMLIFIRSGTKKQSGDGHWLDDPGEYDRQVVIQNSHRDVSKRQERMNDLSRMYDARPQVGDVVEVRPDGYWENRGFDKSVYAVVKVPGLDPATVKTGPVMSHTDDPDNDPPVLLKKFRSRINLPNLKVGEVRVVEEHRQVLNTLLDKANG